MTGDSPYERGRALLERGDLRGAIEAFDAAIAHDPDDAGAWFSKGEALQGRGDEAAAVACFERVCELRPDDPEVFYRHAVALVNAHALISTAPKAYPWEYRDALYSLEAAEMLGHPQAGALRQVVDTFERLRRFTFEKELREHGAAEVPVFRPREVVHKPPEPAPLALLVDRLRDVVAHAGVLQLLRPGVEPDRLEDALRRGGVHELVNVVFRTAGLRVPEIELAEGHVSAISRTSGGREACLVIGADIVRDPGYLQRNLLWRVPPIWQEDTGFQARLYDQLYEAVLVYLGLGVPVARLEHRYGDLVPASNLAALLAIQATVRGDPTLTAATAEALGSPLDDRYEAALRDLDPNARSLRDAFGVIDDRPLHHRADPALDPHPRVLVPLRLRAPRTDDEERMFQGPTRVDRRRDCIRRQVVEVEKGELAAPGGTAQRGQDRALAPRAAAKGLRGGEMSTNYLGLRAEGLRIPARSHASALEALRPQLEARGISPADSATFPAALEAMGFEVKCDGAGDVVRLHPTPDVGGWTKYHGIDRCLESIEPIFSAIAPFVEGTVELEWEREADNPVFSRCESAVWTFDEGELWLFSLKS
jgi:tetratricopeptide (TPR) repeat protein